MKREKTKDALKIIDRQIGNDQEMREMIEQQIVNNCVAQLIYGARTEAGLSQRQLAKLVRTSQPNIARLEDADYEGHSLNMLIRIAAALGKHVDISLIQGATEAGVCCSSQREPEDTAPEQELVTV